ncbi:MULTISPECIES: hypothetical protein [Bacillaceae]|uniref:hypothetical protein n=1 Tax=Bacillaceae TaxID=186817 RepID=UPI001C596FFC|nr:hypothetical protein [Rossellomorea sp. YZS02]MBW3114606.1 hypothetical protein [Bacillus sp. MCCB 382]MDX8345651.1 hypothetical protein [Rossellomorea sp. YZS02]
MTGLIIILLVPIIITIMALNLSSSSKRDYRNGDGGYVGSYDGNQDQAGCDSGFDGGDCGGGGGE